MPMNESMPDACVSPARANRRLYPRYEVQLPVEIVAEGAPAPVALRTANLSLCGCSILVTNQFPVGLRVQMTFVAGEDRVVVHGRVITRHPQLGNGIMFLRFAGDGEERLRRFLEGL